MKTPAIQGVSAFGSHLRRLLEHLDREVLALYRAAGERFEPRWYAVFSSLLNQGPLTVGELSERLGVTHAAVSQVRSTLESEGLIHGAPDPDDGRRQILSLTPYGYETAARLAPLWAGIADAMSALLAENAPALLADLNAVETALDRRSLRTRVDTSLQLERSR